MRLGRAGWKCRPGYLEILTRIWRMGSSCSRFSSIACVTSCDPERANFQNLSREAEPPAAPDLDGGRKVDVVRKQRFQRPPVSLHPLHHRRFCFIVDPRAHGSYTPVTPAQFSVVRVVCTPCILSSHSLRCHRCCLFAVSDGESQQIGGNTSSVSSELKSATSAKKLKWETSGETLSCTVWGKTKCAQMCAPLRTNPMISC